MLLTHTSLTYQPNEHDIGRHCLFDSRKVNYQVVLVLCEVTFKQTPYYYKATSNDQGEFCHLKLLYQDIFDSDIPMYKYPKLARIYNLKPKMLSTPSSPDCFASRERISQLLLYTTHHYTGEKLALNVIFELIKYVYIGFSPRE